jgi:adenine/guanine phosphoribosyltransferase-like PRPP-binding protein
MIEPSPYRVDWFPADAAVSVNPAGPTDRYLVKLHDGCFMSLPLVALPGGDRAVALLMSNQTSFRVERHIVGRLTALVRAAAPEAVVGVPTLGLTYARPVAESVGLPDFVPLGYSRKFWYDEALSEATVSSTSPGQDKRLYLDPALLERVRGRRVVVVDDVLNTGNTMTAALRLLRKVEAEVVAVVAVLSEGWQWQAALARIDPAWPTLVRVLGHIPMFCRTAKGGWAVLPGTDVEDPRER